MSCETCYYYEPETNECWFDVANPKKVTQPKASCDYDTTLPTYGQMVKWQREGWADYS